MLCKAITSPATRNILRSRKSTCSTLRYVNVWRTTAPKAAARLPLSATRSVTRFVSVWTQRARPARWRRRVATHTRGSKPRSADPDPLRVNLRNWEKGKRL